MRKSVLFALILLCLVPVGSISADKVVVVPLGVTQPPVYLKDVAKTGQTLCYQVDGITSETIDCQGSGQDGELQNGAAWPTPRFTNNKNGTVTDNLTGLVWLQDANCDDGMMNWESALNYANNLKHGMCGLTDGSKIGDWHLPNLFELESLRDMSQDSPALPAGQPFSGVVNGYYWSSTSWVKFPQYAWVMGFSEGLQSYTRKDQVSCYVWPVRYSQ